MNAPTESNAKDGLPLVSLRPEEPGDEGFLFEVYASTRAEELALTNWEQPMRLAFLNQQFNAMRRGYRSMFPEGEFSLICLDGQPVGRLVINRSPAEIRVVDIVLLPANRNRGIGTQLIRRVCAEAVGVGKPLRLSVLINNRAGHWYRRLGFALNEERGIYDEMEWRPALDFTGISPTG
jgi:GNAT superfamily N-acetyltransferase